MILSSDADSMSPLDSLVCSPLNISHLLMGLPELCHILLELEGAGGALEWQRDMRFM